MYHTDEWEHWNTRYHLFWPLWFEFEQRSEIRRKNGPNLSQIRIPYTGILPINNSPSLQHLGINNNIGLWDIIVVEYISRLVTCSGLDSIYALVRKIHDPNRASWNLLLIQLAWFGGSIRERRTDSPSEDIANVWPDVCFISNAARQRRRLQTWCLWWQSSKTSQRSKSMPDIFDNRVNQDGKFPITLGYQRSVHPKDSG